MIKVCGFGRLTKDPEYRETTKGTKYISFVVAVRTGHKDKEGNILSNFLNCKMYGARGDIIAEHFQKGDAIMISGSLSLVEYEAKDGNMKHFLDVVVDDFEFGFTKKSKEAPGGMASFGVPVDEMAPVNF